MYKITPWVIQPVCFLENTEMLNSFHIHTHLPFSVELIQISVFEIGRWSKMSDGVSIGILDT